MRLAFIVVLSLATIAIDARTRLVRRPAPETVVQYRGDAERSGVYQGSGPRTFTRTAWQTSIAAASHSAAVYAGGRLYVPIGNGGGLMSLSGTTGAILWTSETLGVFSSPATIAGEVVYVSGENKRTYALSASTGATLWSFLADDWSVGAPLVSNGVMYLGTEAGSVYAIDVATHAQRWRFSTSSPVHATLALSDGRLVFQAIDTIYALDAATGQELWRKRRDGVWFSVTVSDGIVFSTASDGGVYALDARTGIERWRVVTPDSFWTPAAVFNGVVYATNDARRVVALDALTGTERWSREVAEVPTEAILADAVLYVATGTPQSANQNVDRRVYAFEAATGTELFSATVRGHAYTAAAAGDGKLFVVTSRNVVYALE